jgi:hypothetical protein
VPLISWSTIPDLTSRKRLLLTAAVVTLLSALVVILTSYHLFERSLGDTDDAVRLELVRELLQGHGWYHPEIARLQAPWGALMHWSRLLDGGIALLESVFRIGLPPDQAEAATRFTWPLLWLFPAILSVLIIARRLGGGAAVLVCAACIPPTIAAFVQFRPGRVDHHNVQLTMALIGVAAAVAADRRWQGGAIAGLAAAFGLAVGYEALVVHALVGGFFALSLLAKDSGPRPARAYGLTLALSAVGFFLIQTPPRLWTVSVCDTMGANLVAALVISGLGVAAASCLTGARSVRFAALAATGLAAGGVFAAMNPDCLHGPMGGVPPLVAAFIGTMSEMQSFWWTWTAKGPWTTAVIAGPVFALLVLPWLLSRRARWRDPQWLLLSLLLASSFALCLLHVRMGTYPNWLAFAVIGCFVAELAPLWRQLFFPTFFLALLASPSTVALAAINVETLVLPPAPSAKAGTDPPDACFDTASYRSLAGLPPGLILSDIDLGPFIVDLTPHSAMAGPYHRFVRGVTNSFRAFSETPDRAEADVRAMKIAYVVDCPGHWKNFDHIHFGPHGLIAALDKGRAPAWLAPLSRPGEPLQVYRVKPAR